MRQLVRLFSTACLITVVVGLHGCGNDDDPLTPEGEGEGEGEGADGPEGDEGREGVAAAAGEEGEDEGEGPVEGEGEGEGEEGEGEGEEGEGENPDPDPQPSCDDDNPCSGTDLCINTVCIPCGCVDDASCGPDRVCEECACIPRCETHQDCNPGDRCHAETGRCRPREGCENNAQCNGVQACVERACVDPVPESQCDGAIEIASGETAVGSTIQAIDRYSGSCSARPSPDVVYTFEVAEPSGIRILVDGTDHHFDPTVYLRSNCGPDNDAQEISCSDVRFRFIEELELAQVPAGTYYLFIESFRDEAKGDFDVTLEVVPGQICVGDVAEPNDVRDRPANLFQANGENLHLCPGDDDWFSVDLQVGDQVVITADSADGWERLELSCETAAGVRLERPNARVDRPQGQAVLTIENIVEGGQYLCHVGHPDDEARIDYLLDVEVFTLNGTCDCTNPTTLRPYDPDLANAAVGDTCECGHSTAGSCRSAIRHTASEIPFKFKLDDWHSVRIEVDTEIDYIVYMRHACIGEEPENQLACEAADDLEFDALRPGVYYVYVDGRRDECGPFSLKLILGPPNFPPPNNTCDSAQEILVGQRVEGETTFAGNNYRTERAENAGDCQTSPFGHAGRDVVYWFETAEPALIRAELETNDWEGVVYIREDCNLQGSQVACGLAEQEGDPVIAQDDLDPGRYFVFVDGYRTGRGAYSLTLTEVLEDEEPPAEGAGGGGGEAPNE
jgi:hypothetical protein